MSSFKNNNTGIQPVSAAGLERVFQHQKITSQACFGIITAFRREYDQAEYSEKNANLEFYIGVLRFGFFRIKGSFADNTSKETAEEDIYIVYSVPERHDELKDFLKSACKEYGQSAILLVDGDEASFWYPNGEEEILGAFRAAPGDIARAYAKRMGECYWLGEASGDDNSSLGGGVLVFSDCEPEHVPIKTKSNSMFDFMGFQEMRKSLKKNGERFFECRHEESRKIKESDSSKS